MIGGTGHEFPPIFNPIWFYLIELFGRFGVAFVVAGLIGLIGGGIAVFICLMDEKKPPKFIIKIIIAGAIVASIGGLIPSQETCYKMIVTSYITPSNIEAVKGEATDLIDYIVDKVDELTDSDEKDG